MDITLIIKVALVGLVTVFAHQLLKATKNDELAMIALLTGIIIALIMVINLVSDLFDTVRRVFELY
jgi:stage III sporulation protein AC